jgi:polysaccharide biosynthesis/export protein
MMRAIAVGVCLLWAAGAPAQDLSRKGAPLPAAGAARASTPSPAVRAPNARANVPAPAVYLIGPEDVLDISVWKNPELSRSVPVRPDGKVSLPLVNDIQAAGLTPAALREQLTARLAEYLDAPEVAVIVREVHSARVSVIGAVRTPGRYEINSPATVLEAIAMAQGFTDFAAKDRIVVLRANGATQRRIPFSFTRIADGSDQDNFLLQAGDIIVVP